MFKVTTNLGYGRKSIEKQMTWCKNTVFLLTWALSKALVSGLVVTGNLMSPSGALLHGTYAGFTFTGLLRHTYAGRSGRSALDLDVSPSSLAVMRGLGPEEAQVTCFRSKLFLPFDAKKRDFGGSLGFLSFVLFFSPAGADMGAAGENHKTLKFLFPQINRI